MKAGQKQTGKTDTVLWVLVLILVVLGLGALFSASEYNGRVRFHDSAYYFKKQLFATALGLLVMYLASRVDYRLSVKLAPAAYIFSLFLSAAVLLFGQEINGSKRWLNLGPLSFQPSEFSKVAGLVGSNNLSTAVIILGIGVLLIFVANPRYLQFLALGGAGIGFIAVFLAAESYRLERLAIWRDPEKYEKGFQTIQGLYAIGSGGIFGKGFGNSLQKLGFVPEAQNDMIFSIVCEETGILGAFLTLFLFGILIWRLCILALNCRDLQGTLLCAGIMAHMAIQVVLNVAVVTNTIPNTGITLPFVSYGGTSVVFLLGEMGLALSVSSHRHGRIT